MKRAWLVVALFIATQGRSFAPPRGRHGRPFSGHSFGFSADRCSAAGRTELAARARAGHIPPNQRRLLDRADRRRRRPRARRDGQTEARRRGPHAVPRARRRLPLAVGRVQRVQGRADDRRAQRRRPRHGHARQPRVRLRRRRADPAHARGEMAVGGLERGRHRHRQADRRRGALRRPDVRSAEGRLHRPVPDHERDHPRQADAHAARRSARGRGAVPAAAEAGRAPPSSSP